MSDDITAEAVIPEEAPTAFVRLEVDGEEVAMVPWVEAEAIADVVAAHPEVSGDA